MPRKQVNIGFQPDDHERLQTVAAGDDTAATELVRDLTLVGIDAKVTAAAAHGVTVVAFCRAAILDAVDPPEPDPELDTAGVGFLAWVMTLLAMARRPASAARRVT